MNDAKCFLTERTGKTRLHISAQTLVSENPALACSGRDGWSHHAARWLGIEDEVQREDEHGIYYSAPAVDLNDDTLPWPTHCDTCGYAFGSQGEFVSRGAGYEAIYRHAETGEEYQTWRDIPPGGIQMAPWLDRFYTAQLGHCFNVKCPDGTWWCPDGMASNCSMPDDFKQVKHHCWVIEGQLPNISVTKNGPTCAAGAGSIQTPGWHGFLIDGWLRSC